MTYILWLNQIDKDDKEIVGGKGANLGEIKRLVTSVPDGFVLTSTAYFDFLKENNLDEQIKVILGKLDFKNPKLVEEISSHLVDIIRVAQMPEEIVSEVKKSYQRLTKKKKYVAVRSSATVEDTSLASFAGQFETYINLKSVDEVLDSIKKCWSSLYEPRTLFYVRERGIDGSKIGVAAMIQEMIQADASGVMFTIDPVTNNKSRIVVEAVFGLGSLMVKGIVTPDHYEIAKHSFTVISRDIGTQNKQLILADDKNKEIPVAAIYKNEQKIPDTKLVELAKIGKKIEDAYLFPQDIEWAMEDEKLFILQSRPVTSVEKEPKQKYKKVKIDLPVLVKGAAASPGIVQGIAKIIRSVKDIKDARRGDILILPASNQNYEPALKKAAAVITDKGGETSHAAIISREVGIPCVAGTSIATNLVSSGTVVTVNGSLGTVYEGSLPYRKLNVLETKYADNNKSDSSKEKQIDTATKVLVNLVDSSVASIISQRHVDGVGLLRAEFSASEVGIHPKKLIEERKDNLFTNKLIDSMRVACASFDPRPVIYRSLDFTSNEFRNFKDGHRYESNEINPTMGYRGAIRNIEDPSVFALELTSIKTVRNKYNLRNLWLLVPFVRSLEEMAGIKRLVAAAGLHRSSSFKLLMSVEVPANVVLIDKYLDIGLDGVSIDLADLTSLMLSADTGNEKLFESYSGLDESVFWSLERVIKETAKRKIFSSVVGQGSIFQLKLIDKLVEWGVTSVSVSPDMIEGTRNIIYESEQNLVVSRKK